MENKTKNTKRISHFICNIILLVIGITFGIFAYLEAMGGGPFPISTLFPSDILNVLIATSVILFFSSLIGCAGGYRQYALHVKIYIILILLSLTLQLYLFTQSLIYYIRASYYSEQAWNSASMDVKKDWTNYFQCCAFHQDMSMCTYYNDMINDCSPILTDYISKQSLILWIVMLLVTLLTIGASISSFIWVRSLKPSTQPLQIKTMREFEHYVLDKEQIYEE